MIVWHAHLADLVSAIKVAYLFLPDITMSGECALYSGREN